MRATTAPLAFLALLRSPNFPKSIGLALQCVSLGPTPVSAVRHMATKHQAANSGEAVDESAERTAKPQRTASIKSVILFPGSKGGERQAARLHQSARQPKVPFSQ